MTTQIKQPHQRMRELMLDKKIGLFLTVTGGGSKVFEMITAKGGSSAYFIGGNLPYDQTSVDLLYSRNSSPEKYTSLRTARGLAISGYENHLHWLYRNSKIIPAAKGKVLSVAATATLGYEGQREGRVNKICIAGYTHQTCFEIEKNLYGDREAQELEAANSIYDFIMEVISQDWDNLPMISKTSSGVTYVNEKLVLKNNPIKEDNVAIIPGSFNPMHPGHMELKRVTRQYMPDVKNVLFEMTTENLYKPPLCGLDIAERVMQIKDIDPTNEVFITHEAFMEMKAMAILEENPHIKKLTFVVGDDVFKRMLEYRDTKHWMENDERIRILVVPREYESIHDLPHIKNPMHHKYIHGASFILKRKQLLVEPGLSSTKIRNQK